MPEPFDEITIVRHGRSAHALVGGRMTAAGFRAWIDAYNAASIDDASVPPGELVDAVGGVACVVCSDLRRGVASARRLCPRCEPRVSPLFREVGRPLRGNWGVRMSLLSWDRVSLVFWRLGWSPCDEPRRAALARASEAADELAGLARVHGRVLYVGHGMFNAMVGDALRHRGGWDGPARADDSHWGAATYRRRR